MNTEQISESVFTYSTLRVLAYVKVKLQKKTLAALKSMPNGKSPGHDGITKEFYEHFWDNLKVHVINFLKESEIDGCLPISQRQAIINLVVKKKETKNLLKTGDQSRYLILTQKRYLTQLQKN